MWYKIWQTLSIKLFVDSSILFIFLPCCLSGFIMSSIPSTSIPNRIVIVGKILCKDLRPNFGKHHFSASGQISNN